MGRRLGGPAAALGPIQGVPFFCKDAFSEVQSLPSQLRRDADERVIQVSEDVLGVVGRDAGLRPKTTRPQQSRELSTQTEQGIPQTRGKESRSRGMFED